MSDVFDDINPDELNWGTDAKQAAIGGLQADPEKSAEAMRLSQQTGAPAVAIEQDPEPFKLQTRTQALNDIFSNNAEIQKYATGNPQAPKVSNDDWENLNVFSKWMKTLRTDVPAALAQNAQEQDDWIKKEQEETDARNADIVGQFGAGGLSYERGALGTKMAAMNTLGQPIEPTVEQRVADIEKSLQGIGSAKTFFGQLSNMVGTLVPSVGPAFGGAAVGSVAPGIGTAGGALAGLATDQGRIAAGNAYIDGMKMGLDPTANLLQSVARGVVAGGLWAVGGAEAGAPLEAGIKAITDGAATRVLSNATWTQMFTRAATGIAKQGMLGAAIGGAQTLSDEIFSGLAKEFTSAKSGKEWATIFNDPEERARMTDTVTEAMIQTAEFFTLLHIPALGINMHVDAMHISQSKTNARMLDGVLNARDATKTWTRSPELIDEFVKQHELGDIGLDPNVALQIHKDNPAAFSFIPDFESKAIEAQQAGGLVSLPAGDYISKVGPELHQQLKDDLSINGEMTVNEARLLEESPPKYTSVFHGSPYLFDKFDISKIGTGEGAQAYGHGHYLTEDRGIAEGYRDRLSQDKQGSGDLFIDGKPHEYPPDNTEWSPKDQAISDIHDIHQQDGYGSIEEARQAHEMDLRDQVRNGETDLAKYVNDPNKYHSRMVDVTRKQLERTKAELAETQALKDRMVLQPKDLFPTLYRANITAHPDSFLHWDQPISEQPAIQAALEKVAAILEKATNDDNLFSHLNNKVSESTLKALRDGSATGETVIHELEREVGPEDTRRLLHDAGINGVKYRAAGHRRVNANGKLVKYLKVGNEEFNPRDPDHKFATDVDMAGGPDAYVTEQENAKSRYQATYDKLEKESGEVEKMTDAEFEKYANDKYLQRPYIDEMLGELTPEEKAKRELDYMRDARVQRLKSLMMDADDEIRGAQARIDDVRQREVMDNGDSLRVEKTEEDPLHNYVVFNDDHIEITHRNDEEYPPKAPPEIASDPKAEDVYYSTAKDLDVVAKAEARGAGLNGLFADAKAAGMTKAEYALYQRKLAKAQIAQDDKVYAAAAKEAKKRLTKTWKENTDRVRGEVASELALDPDFMAVRAMSEGKGPDGGDVPKVRLDAKAVKEMLGDYAGNRADYPDTLPKGITEKDGIHPDDAAQLFGYDSGQEMLAKLGAAETDRVERGESWKQRFDRAVDEETQRRMEAQYGKLEDAIVQEAREAALNAEAINILSEELKQLARLTGIDTPFTKSDLEAKVAEVFDRRVVGKEVKPDQWIKNAGRMARQAEMMLLRGKYAEAYMAKQRQMLAVRLAKEAAAFARESKRFDRDVKPFLENEALNKVEQGYTDQIQRTLNMLLQYPTKRDMAELQRGNGKSLSDFVDEKAAANRQIDIPEFFTDQQFQAQQDRRPQTLTVQRWREMRDFFQQMIFHGKDEKEAIVNGNAVAMADARQAAIESAGKLRQAWNDNPKTAKGAVQKAMKIYDAAYLKADRLLSWLGGRDPNSPWMQIVVRPLQAAKHRSSDLAREISTAFKELGKVDRTYDAVSDSPFRDSLGNKIYTDRETLLMSMLNAGNDSNLRVLAQGYHTTPDEVMNWIHNNAREADWKWVQGVWDIFQEKLFPIQEAAARENTGVGLKQIIAREIDTPHGTFRGGYFPLMEDFRAIDKMKGKTNPFDNPNGFPPVPTANWMNRRTGASYPLSLSLDSISSKVNDIIHYVSYSKAWKDAHNFMDNPGMKNAVDKAFGTEYRDSLDSWMQYVATNGGRYRRTGLEGLAKGIRFMRENMITALIGAKLGTAVIHGGAAFFNSIAEVGFKPFLKATADMVFRSPENYDKWSTFALEKSGELRNRKGYIDRDIAGAMQESVTANGFMRARASYASFVGGVIAHLDQASAIPTWIAAFQHFSKEFDGKYDDAEARAIFAADQAVRQAHGANGLTDLSAIMRTSGAEGELAKFFTAFGGFFNHYYNQLRDAGRAAPESIEAVRSGNFSEASVLGMKVMGGLVGYLLAGSMWHSFVRKTDDEDFFSGKHIASAVGEQLLSTQFGLRDAAFWWKTGHRDKVNVASPMGEILTSLLAPIADLDSYSKHKMPDKWIANLGKSATFATGIGPTNSMADMMQYLINHANGRARSPGTYWEWQRLLLDSKAPANRRRH